LHGLRTVPVPGCARTAAGATPARRLLLLGALVENPGHSSAEELAAYGLGAVHVQVDHLRETPF
jgi:hypothetical protein